MTNAARSGGAGKGQPGSGDTSVRLTGLVATNLFLVIVLGVAACGWILWFTDYFPAVGGLLALGGAFSWLAFISKALPEDVMNGLQLNIYRFLFKSRSFTLALVVAAVGGLWYACAHGSIQIDSPFGGQEATGWVYLYRDEKPEGRPAQLTAGGSVRIPVSANLGSATEWAVKVPGYPAAFQEVKSLQKKRLYVPNSFRRRVVLVRPDPKVASSWRDRHVKLTVTLLDRKWTDETYDGYSFWIGCDADVRIPEEIATETNDLLVHANDPHVRTKLLQPRSLSELSGKHTSPPMTDEYRLEAGTKIHIRIEATGRKVRSISETVASLGSTSSFVQVIPIDPLTGGP